MKQNETISFCDLEFTWKDECYQKHGNLNEVFYDFTNKDYSKRKMTHKQQITSAIWYVLKNYSPLRVLGIKEKRKAIANMIATKLVHKEAIDFAITYINENIKF